MLHQVLLFSVPLGSVNTSVKLFLSSVTAATRVVSTLVLHCVSLKCNRNNVCVIIELDSRRIS